jgi:hypothetical protein
MTVTTIKTTIIVYVSADVDIGIQNVDQLKCSFGTALTRYLTLSLIPSPLPHVSPLRTCEFLIYRKSIDIHYWIN